jgi:hypothetical protein
LELPKQKKTHADVDYAYEHKKDATQVLGRGGQAAARSSSLSQALNLGTQAVARGAVPFASQILDRDAEAAARGAQAGA